jgi:hypothetical protein
MGRHRSGTGGGHGLLRAAGAVALVAATVAGVLTALDRGSGGQAGQSALLAGSGCTRTLRVVTASSFAPVLSALRPGLAAGPGCVELDTVVVDGRAAADRVAERQADLWIPDDVSWAAVARPGLLAEEGAAGAGTVLATSPIYMVTDAPTAARVRAAGGSWLGLARLVTGGSGVRLAVRDPNGSGDGMVAAGSLGEAVWLSDGMDASSAALSAALRWTRTVGGAAAAMPDRAGEVGLVAEHTLAGTAPAAVLSGSDHTALLRYGWLPSAAAVQTPERAAALAALLDTLKAADAAPAYAAAHLRRPDGPAPAGLPAGLPALTAGPLRILGPHHVDHVFAAWYVQDRRSSILLAVDVSGSMADPAPGTSTPLIDLVRQGCLAVGRLLPDQSSLGLWAFGSRLAPPLDHAVLLPAAPLSEGQRAGLAGAVGRLRAERTGTGLYDTILAAYRSATGSYQEGVGNQVVVFTDGRNEDDPESISAAQLAAGLAEAADPARRVELTVVAFGDRPEVAALATALKPVGGYVSQVRTPTEVAAAFLHAAASGVHD